MLKLGHYVLFLERLIQIITPAEAVDTFSRILEIIDVVVV